MLNYCYVYDWPSFVNRHQSLLRFRLYNTSLNIAPKSGLPIQEDTLIERRQRYLLQMICHKHPWRRGRNHWLWVYYDSDNQSQPIPGTNQLQAELL